MTGVQWPGGGLAGPRSHSRRVYRVATIFSPPFVMETEVFKEDDEEFEIEYNDNMLQNKPDRLQILVSDDMFLNVYFSNSDGKFKCWLLIFVSNTCEMFVSF